MSFDYVAYGLQLSSTAPLAGMLPDARRTDLPRLHLDFVDPAALEKWEEEAGQLEWEGLLGDGRPLRIERADAGERLFRYGERACFLLDGSSSSLRCVPISSDMAVQRVLLSKVIATVAVIRGREALHAASLGNSTEAVLIAAPSGMGKTTLALELIGRGWSLLADDVTVLAHDGAGVQALPGTPHMNIDCDRAVVDADFGRTLATFGGEHWISVEAAARHGRPIGAIFLLERAATLTLDARPLPANPLPLSPYMLGLNADLDRRRSRFDLYGALVEDAALWHLTCGKDDRPSELADALEAALAPQAPAMETL